ncbi:deoxyribonuclease IV [Buchnera aphidicola]|uniref:Probable endonuclease 4 n=1 Tax=Buchnera aphidicola subsp. Tuberolachnus salignus TaxID=98804 RepID=A0A160SYS1_BUCTT|nr:deoxyribonuclease IV [Buchnera aphidicola]CUR53076.1 Endonuclease 4 [Buchnera aphidicola (Tuberolachnus salignus)]
MKYIGAHVSSAGGIENSVLRAYQIGATAFALFVKNQRRWVSKPLTEFSKISFKKNCKNYGYSPQQILPHSSYLINLGHPDDYLRKKSQFFFIQEIKICFELGLSMINFHPGSFLSVISEKKCLQNIIKSINTILNCTTGIVLVIENTAGQGSNVGYCFEHLAYIIKYVEDKTRIGICLDSCHLFAAGYELRNFSSFLNTFKKFEDIVGFKYLKGLHLNDSCMPLNSRIDRHENLGKGYIKKFFFEWIMKSQQFINIPIILETKDFNLWPIEIQWLKKIQKGKIIDILTS